MYSSEISMHSSQEDGDHHHHEKRGSNSNSKRKEVIKYMACQKNHAAGLGGHSTDGCGEFMAGGEEGTTMEALKCAACNCHRNFHKRIVTLIEEAEQQDDQPKNAAAPEHQSVKINIRSDPDPEEKYFFGLRSPPKASRSMEKKEEEDEGHHERKRHRTKFSLEQKEKMRRFAERAGWRIQRVDESAVNQFCQEIGIKRRVLKVWMHNNKYTLANNKKGSPSSAASI